MTNIKLIVEQVKIRRWIAVARKLDAAILPDVKRGKKAHVHRSGRG
ncbi:MAG: hypothetical protein U5L45_09560 [Saprospiraceae bacterium]|nr:hypothetical protein [Saprospiraceae bacterium]